MREDKDGTCEWDDPEPGSDAEPRQIHMSSRRCTYVPGVQLGVRVHWLHAIVKVVMTDLFGTRRRSLHHSTGMDFSSSDHRPIDLLIECLWYAVVSVQDVRLITQLCRETLHHQLLLFLSDEFAF